VGRSAGLVIRPFPAYVSDQAPTNIHLHARSVTPLRTVASNEPSRVFVEWPTFENSLGPEPGEVEDRRQIEDPLCQIAPNRRRLLESVA
jgi:hypothetical protein